MRWSCPHCGVMLAVAEHVLGTGWSFSRCFKCGGFALVRRAEINVIKVDKAPPGERVILPEASADSSTGLPSEKVVKTVEKYSAPKIQKPTQSTSSPLLSNQNSLTQLQSIDISSAILPEPLPEIRGERKSSKAIPAGIFTTALLVLVSGAYFYLQGQKLWRKLKENSAKPEIFAQTEQHNLAPPLPVVPHNDLSAVEKSLTTTLNQNSQEIADELKKSAMAPIRAEDKANSTLPLSVEIISPTAHLRAGPGLLFPITSSVAQKSQFQVLDWTNRWFKVQQMKTETPLTGWIRNDLIRVVH